MLLFTCFVLSFVSRVAILQFRFQFCKWQNDDLASRNILHNHYDHLWRYLSSQNLSSFFSIILILTKKILDFWVEKSKMLLKCAMFLKCVYHFEVQIFFLTSGNFLKMLFRSLGKHNVDPRLKWRPQVDLKNQKALQSSSK